MKRSIRLSRQVLAAFTLAGCAATDDGSRGIPADAHIPIDVRTPNDQGGCHPGTCDQACTSVGRLGGACRGDLCTCLGDDADASTATTAYCTVSPSAGAADTVLVFCPQNSFRTFGADSLQGPLNPAGTIVPVLRNRLVAVSVGGGQRWVDAAATAPRTVYLTAESSEMELRRRAAGLVAALVAQRYASGAIVTRSLAGVAVRETLSGDELAYEAVNPALRWVVLRAPAVGTGQWIFVPPRQAGLGRLIGAVRGFFEGRDAVSATRSWRWPRAAVCDVSGARLDAVAGLAAPAIASASSLAAAVRPPAELTARLDEAISLGWNSDENSREAWIAAQVLDLFNVVVTMSVEIASASAEVEPSSIAACAADVLGPAVLERLTTDVAPRIVEALLSRRAFTAEELAAMIVDAIIEEIPRLALDAATNPICLARAGCTAATTATGPAGAMCRAAISLGNALRHGVTGGLYLGDLALAGATEFLTLPPRDTSELPFDREVCPGDAGARADASDVVDVAQPRDVVDVAQPRDVVDVAPPRDVVDVAPPRDVVDVAQPRDVPTPVCVPSVATCATATARRVCNVDGLGYTTAECPAATGATAVCSGGACGIACNSGRGNCDGALANGCEINTQTDAAHCGACGRACSTGQGCSAGTCVAPVICTSGDRRCASSSAYETCSSDGTRWVRTSCASGASCVGGVCTSVPQCAFESHNDGGYPGVAGGDCAAVRGVPRCFQAAAYCATSTTPGIECFASYDERSTSMSIDFDTTSSCTRGSFLYRGNLTATCGACPERVAVDIVLNGGALRWRCASSQVSYTASGSCAVVVNCPFDVAGTSQTRIDRVDPWFIYTIAGRTYYRGTAYSNTCR